MSNRQNRRQILVFILLVIGLSYLIFWGPIALLKLKTANLDIFLLTKATFEKLLGLDFHQTTDHYQKMVAAAADLVEHREVLYLDDCPLALLTAQQLGIRTLHVRNAIFDQVQYQAVQGFVPYSVGSLDEVVTLLTQWARQPEWS